MLDQLPFHTVDITKSGYDGFLTPSITIGKIAGPTYRKSNDFFGCGGFHQFS